MIDYVFTQPISSVARDHASIEQLILDFVPLMASNPDKQSWVRQTRAQELTFLAIIAQEVFDLAYSNDVVSRVLRDIHAAERFGSTQINLMMRICDDAGLLSVSLYVCAKTGEV